MNLFYQKVLKCPEDFLVLEKDPNRFLLSVPLLNIRYNEEEEVSMKISELGNSEAFIQYTYSYKGGNMKYYYGLSYFEDVVCVLCTYSNIGCGKFESDSQLIVENICE